MESYSWGTILASYAAVGGVVAAAAVYYTQGAKPNRRTSIARQTSDSTSQPHPRKRQDKRQKPLDGAAQALNDVTNLANGDGQPKKRKQRKEPVVVQEQSYAATARASTAAESDADDKAWAEQLNAARQGVTIKPQGKPTGAPLSKSKKRQQGAAPTSDPFEASSAGDTLSSHDNTFAASQPSGTDVSDMLEAAKPAPTVVRLTGEEKPKKVKAEKVETPQETKKQRQNRRKAEEKKALREEDEKQRQVLLEKQRRMAREARGEPAKNGVVASTAPSKSAWTSSTGSTPAAATTNGHARQLGEATLLDTFDHDVSSMASSNEHVTNATSPATAASTLEADLPSEEAQVEQLRELNGWNEVTKTKKGKKKAQGPASPPPEPAVKSIPKFASTEASELVSADSKAPGLPAKSAPASNPYAALETPRSSAATMKAHPDDSDWVVG